MPGFAEPPKENPSTYMVQDRENRDEIARLETQDKMLTTGMGGVLPELSDPAVLSSVLDVGCGTGGWLRETARTYPTIEKLVGGDISGQMMEYARAQAKAELLDERVQFKTMDALRVLEFPVGSFDLVNQRLGGSWLRTWDWKKILLEYQRVCRPGGIIRITDANVIESNSPALTKLLDIFLMVFYRSGRFFEEERSGLTSRLASLMTQYGIEDVQTRVCTLVYRAGTESTQDFCRDMVLTFHVLLPFFQKWTRVPSDYQEISQQALKEMEQPDFVATWTLLTAWGIRPRTGHSILMRGLR